MKILSIRKSAEFKTINNKGSKFISKLVILLSHPTSQFYVCDPLKGKNSANFCRVGYTVSKTVGNAVTRNRAKRRLREAFRDLVPEYAKANYDYVIIARKEIAEANFEDVVSNLKFCIKRIHQPKKDQKDQRPIKPRNE